jgi:hypothetical protein
MSRLLLSECHTGEILNANTWRFIKGLIEQKRVFNIEVTRTRLLPQVSYVKSLISVKDFIREIEQTYLVLWKYKRTTTGNLILKKDNVIFRMIMLKVSKKNSIEPKKFNSALEPIVFDCSNNTGEEDSLWN